jgi:glycerol-3-phosphate acyltransferase PlsY
VFEISYLIGAYLLGSIPVGFILCFLTKKKDIRHEGSGNIGATNVMRTTGKAAGIATLTLDMLKGIIPVIIGKLYFDSPFLIFLGGAAAVLGHLFPVCLKFRGGKGIACFIGVMIAFYYPLALYFAIGFLPVFYFSRYVSISSVIGVSTVWVFSIWLQPWNISTGILLIAIIIIMKHYPNFKRIATGTEYHLSWTKPTNEKT